MTNTEIKERIAQLENKIKEVFNPGIFTLNQVIQELNDEIADLRSQCNHTFENGKCTNCGKLEK